MIRKIPFGEMVRNMVNYVSNYDERIVFHTNNIEDETYKGVRFDLVESSFNRLKEYGRVFQGTIDDVLEEIAGRIGLSRDKYLQECKELPAIWNMRRKLGLPTTTFKQEVGDCVAASKKQSDDDRLAFRKYMGEELQPLNCFPPYLYAISRNQILGGLSGDGSTGSAIVQAQNKYGTLFMEDEGVPEYSGSIARSWGSRRYVNLESAPYYKFVPVARNNVSYYVPLNSAEEVFNATACGLFPIIASTWGFSFKVIEGVLCYVHTTTWYHQMYFCAVREKPFKAVFRRNSWGDSHGQGLNPNDEEYKGGAWQSLESLEQELRSSRGIEVFACYDLVPEPSDEDYSTI